MHCPECGYEYREGFFRCPDCNVALKPGPPPGRREQGSSPLPSQHMGYDNYVQAMDTPDYAFITFIRSLLDAEGIRSYLLGEHVNSIYPMGLGIKLMVHEDDIEDAMEIIRDVDEKLQEPPSFGIDPETGQETVPEDEAPDDGDGRGFHED